LYRGRFKDNRGRGTQWIGHYGRGRKKREVMERKAILYISNSFSLIFLTFYDLASLLYESAAQRGTHRERQAKQAAHYEGGMVREERGEIEQMISIQIHK